MPFKSGFRVGLEWVLRAYTLSPQRNDYCDHSVARNLEGKSAAPPLRRERLSGWSKTSVPFKSEFKRGFKWVLRAYSHTPT